jgi:hypothetical protein
VPVSGQLSPRRIIQSNVVPLGNLVAMRAVNIWNIYYVRCLARHYPFQLSSAEDFLEFAGFARRPTFKQGG